MRVLICDDHVVFAESLGHVIAARGLQVVAITYHPSQAAVVLRREPVDVLLMDLTYGRDTFLNRLEQLAALAPQTKLVVLSAQVDDAVRAAGAAGLVRGIGEKRQSIDELLAMLVTVHTGGTVLPDRRPAGPPTTLAGLGAAAADPGEPLDPAASAASPHAQRLSAFFTPRERDVLSALVCGEGTTNLARRLGIAQSTARFHIQAVLVKLGVHSRLEATSTAVRYGLVSPHDGQWLVAPV